MRGTVALLVALALAAAAAPVVAAAAADVDLEPRLLYRPPAVEQAEAARNGQRAILEFSAILLYENIRYWVTYGDWVEDWQYELSWDDQKQKLLDLDGVRFDSNDFGTNWTHAYAGALYYTIGRINNLGVKDALLLSSFESLYWEGVVEWREVFSLNDTLLTMFGAFSIGEPCYQLGRYLVTRSNPVARALGFIHPLGLTVQLDPDSRPRPTEHQTLPGHGVLLSVGTASTDSRYPSDDGGFVSLGLRSQFALAPGFTSPGTESRQGWDVFSSIADFNADLDDGRIRELDVFSEAVFYGRLERSVGEDSRGSATILGIGSAFTLFRKAPVVVYDSGEVKVRQGYDLRLEEPRDFRDKYAIVHLFGPVYEGYWRGATLGVAWALEAYPDFAMVNAYALNAYSADHDIAGAKTTLLYYGYYYGYGASLKARLAADAGPFAVGVAASIHYHESIEGIDRFEDELTGDVHATDTWYRFGVTLGVRIPRTPCAVEASARWSERRGTVGDTDARGTESRYTLGITYRL